MTSMTIIKKDQIETQQLTPAGLRPGFDKGQPHMALFELADNAQGDIGIWECEPGSWPIVDRPNTEFCYIISGKAILTDSETNESIPVTKGDLIILPVGWTGRWEIIETVRKIYTIY